MTAPTDPTPLDARLRQLLDAHDRVVTTLPDANEALQRLSARMEQEHKKSTTQTQSSTNPASIRRASLKPFPRRTLIRIGMASAIIAFAAITVAVPSLRTIVTRPFQPAAPHEYTTVRAQQRSLELPDGSRVILAPETSLRYAVDQTGTRTVELTGQAYFTVTHDPVRPFLVRTPKTTTRVLGTAFVVRAYASDQVTQVAVSEGRVALGSGTETVVLLAGDVGRALRNHAPHITHDLSINDVFGWMRGQLAFRNAPLREVVAELERTYDLDIRFADSTLADRPITATFAGGSAGTMLDAITIAADVQYRRNGRVVELFLNVERAE